MSSIDYREVKNYPLEEARIGVFTARRLVHCAWPDRYTLANDFLTPGSADFVYPYTDFTVALARKVRIRNLPNVRQSEGDTAEEARYTRALLEVFYSTAGPALRNGTTLLHEEFHPKLKGRVMSEEGLVWNVGDDAKKLTPGDAGPRFEAQGDYLLQYPREVLIPATTLTHPGSVNGDAVAAYWLGYIFAPETLLYWGADIIHNVGTDGSRTYDIRHSFSYKANDNGEGPLGWNWHWRQDTQQYEEIRDVDGNVLKRYPLKDFEF